MKNVESMNVSNSFKKQDYWDKYNMRKYYIVKTNWALVGDVYSVYKSSEEARQYVSAHHNAEIWWEGTRDEYVAKVEELKARGIQVY